MKISLKGRLQELYYWHVLRKTERFIPWAARKLPKKLRYYVVIDAAAKTEPRFNPGDVTALQMLKTLDFETSK